MALVQSPCMGCEMRTITCHGNCEEYAEWKKGRNLESAQIREERANSRFIHYNESRRKRRR